MNAMALEFQNSNHRMHNLMQALTATTPELPHTTSGRLPPTLGTTLANAQEGEHTSTSTTGLFRGPIPEPIH